MKAKAADRATRVLDGGCERAEAEACYVRGVMLAGTDDLAGSLRKMGRACVLGHGPACLIVGDGHARGAKGIGQNAAAAKASYLRGCALGEARACKRLGK